MKKFSLAICSLFALFLTRAALSESILNMSKGVTPISEDIYHLHMTALIVCSLIGLTVFGLVGYCIFFFRKSKGAKPASFSENTKLEIVWTIIPFLILIGLAIPATKILGGIHDTSESDITIKVTGYQWKWQYEYLDSDLSFFSFLKTPLQAVDGSIKKDKWYLLEVDNEIVVPVNTKVKLLVTSDDVIHSWWVPKLGVKQDAIPGFINENWFYAKKTGTYRGQCAELCGINHAFMPIVVKVVTQGEYEAWVKNKKRELAQLASATTVSMTHADLMRLGKIEYDKNCVMCHRPNGEGLAYSFPALKGSRVVTAPVNETVLYVLRGVPNAAMQSFANILDDKELAAVITYIRNSWGNDSIIKQQDYALDVSSKNVALMRKRLAGNME